MGKQKKATPTAYQLRISTNALKNIDEITGYIAFVNFQPLNAIKVGDAIFSVISRIAKNPLAFRECDEIPTMAKKYRRAVCLSWLIIYKIVQFGITILGVIHVSRKPSTIKSIRKVN